MKNKQKTIGINPLDFYLSYKKEHEQESAALENLENKDIIENNIKNNLETNNLAQGNLNENFLVKERIDSQDNLASAENNNLEVSKLENLEVKIDNSNKQEAAKEIEQEEQMISQLSENTRANNINANLNNNINNIGVSVADRSINGQEYSAQGDIKQFLDQDCEESEAVKKERITLHIPSELVDKVKNAVYWEPGLTLAGFAEIALYKLLDQLEAERGAPFPPRRRHRLYGGRPIK